MTDHLIIDLVRHMKARNRSKWGAADDERPLSKSGLRQAAFHAEAMAAGDPIVAVYSSPALRCRQTIEPLAQRLGLDLRIEPLLAERGHFFVPIGGKNALLERLRNAHHEGGRVVLCSHGNTIPAFIESIDAVSAQRLPAVLEGFGGWYRVVLDDTRPAVEHFPAPEGFPAD